MELITRSLGKSYPLIWTVIIGFFIVMSCTEESLLNADAEMAEEDPFQLLFELDGNTLDLNDPNYIVRTKFDNNAGLNRFYSEILETGCTDNCGPSLQFIFNDIVDRPLTEVNIDEVLRLGDYELISPVLLPAFPIYKFQALSANDGSTDSDVDLCWSDDLGNMTCGTECLADSTFFPSLLTASYTDGTQIQYMRIFSVVTADATGPLDVLPPEVCISRTDDPTIYQISMGQLMESDTVLWSLGNTLQEEPTQNLLISEDDLSQSIKVQIINTREFSTSPTEITIRIDPETYEGSKCFAGYLFNPIESAGISTDAGKLEIVFTDVDGRSFSTRHNFSRGIDQFVIESIEEFVPDPKGNPSKLFNCHFNVALVHEASGDVMRLGSADASLPLSYPGQ